MIDPIQDFIDAAREVGLTLTREEVGSWTPDQLKAFADEVAAHADMLTTYAHQAGAAWLAGLGEWTP